MCDFARRQQGLYLSPLWRLAKESVVTVLVPMCADGFGAFLEASAAGYADDNIKSGRWPREGAHDRAMSELKDYLPQGVDTPDNYLFDILASPGGTAVGYVWCAIHDKYGQRSAFVYDVEIKPEFRRQGYAAGAFSALQEHLLTLGIQGLGLHVFAFNKGAISLYEKLGFVATGMNMQKNLGGSD